jgi:hypothetical protein
MKKILLLLGLLVLIAGCATPYQAPVGGSGTYTSDDFGFSIDYPADWIVAEAPGTGVSFLGNYDYLANIIVSVEEYDGTLQEAWEEQIEDLERSNILIGTQTYSDVLTTVNGYNAIEIDYSYIMGEEVMVKQYLFVENGYAYAVFYQTYTDYFDDHMTDFEESLASFSF